MASSGIPSRDTRLRLMREAAIKLGATGPLHAFERLLLQDTPGELHALYRVQLDAGRFRVKPCMRFAAVWRIDAAPEIRRITTSERKRLGGHKSPARVSDDAQLEALADRLLAAAGVTGGEP